MQTIVKNGIKFIIGDAGSIAKTVEPKNSYIVLSFQYKGQFKQLYLASKSYARDRNERFYRDNKIDINVSLLKIPHGTIDDSAVNTMPLFNKSAAEIAHAFSRYPKALVNCNHGRSRTGAVVALFLINYLHLNADDALHIVTEALKARGYKGGIDLKGGCHGTYGDWIRQFELEKNKENDDLDPNRLTLSETRKRARKVLGNDAFFSEVRTKAQYELPVTRSGRAASVIVERTEPLLNFS